MRKKDPRIPERNAKIRAGRALGKSLKELQREFGLDFTTISAICHGRVGYGEVVLEVPIFSQVAAL